jgi:hypothetical protein
VKLPRISIDRVRTAASLGIEISGLMLISSALGLWHPLVGLGFAGIALVYIAQGI